MSGNVLPGKRPRVGHRRRARNRSRRQPAFGATIRLQGAEFGDRRPGLARLLNALRPRIGNIAEMGVLPTADETAASGVEGERSAPQGPLPLR